MNERMTGGAVSTSMGRRLIWPGFFAAVAFAILMSLGFWQMQRLHWKEDLLAKIDARTHAAPAQLPLPEQWGVLSSEDQEYARYSLTGTFEHRWESLIFRPIGGTDRQPGYQVMTPLRISGTDKFVVINRGYVPEALKAPSSRMAGQTAGEVHITGLLRAPEVRGPFTPTDEPSRGLWYTRDPPAIARHFAIAGTADFSIDADDAPNPGGWPKGGTTVVVIKNDHLSYAATWFGLAATLLAVFSLFAWRQVNSH